MQIFEVHWNESACRKSGRIGLEQVIAWLTVGGEELTYNELVSAPTADVTTVKIHWNIFLFTLDGKYLTVDVKNVYLKNPMKKSKYNKSR